MILLRPLDVARVHDARWLRLVPDDDRERATPRSFRGSWAALVSDLGPVVIAVVVVSAAFIGGAFVFGIRPARDAYLRGASFHGHLEIVAMAFALVRGRLRA